MGTLLDAWHSQFEHPRGPLGRLAGRVMALGNVRMAALAVDILAPRPEDRVLELAFGPGAALLRLAPRLPAGLLAGLDASPDMLEVARRRLASARQPASLDLRCGDAAALPWPDGSFDAVLEMNSLKVLPDTAAVLAEVYRVLAPGGRLVVLLRMLHPRRRRLVAPGNRLRTVVETLDAVRAAGFADARAARRRAGARAVEVVTARRLPPLDRR